MKRVSMFVRVMMVTLIMTMFFSCNQDVKRIKVDNQIALSLFSDTVRVGDLIDGMGETASQFIRISEDGCIYAYYADSVSNAVVASDILSGIQDVDFETGTSFEVPTVPPSPVPVPIELPFENIFSIPFEYEGYEINKVELKSGRLYFEFSTNLDLIDNIKLTTNNIRLADNSSLELTIDFNENSICVVDIDLADCKIEPVDGSIYFSALLAATVSDQGIGGTYDISVLGSVSDIKFKSIDGAIHDSRFDFIGSRELSLAFPNLYGDLKIATPEFSIKYINTFGFEANGFIDSLYLADASGNYTSLIKDWNEVEMTLLPTGDGYDSITYLDDEIIDEINILDDYKIITFNGNIVVGCDEVAANMITDDSHIDIIADLALPLEFNIENLSYIDTLPFNLSLNSNSDVEGSVDNSGTIEVENIFDEIEFKFVFENAIPVQIKPQMYMLENGIVIDSLFDGTSLIHGNFDGTIVEDVIVINASDDKLHNIQCADHLILSIALSSHGNNVVIKTSDFFNLKIGMKTKTTEINMEDLNK